MSLSAEAGMEEQQWQGEGSFLSPLRAIILAINEDTSPAEEVLAAYNSVKAHAPEIRELVKLCEQHAKDWIRLHCDLVAGP